MIKILTWQERIAAKYSNTPAVVNHMIRYSTSDVELAMQAQIDELTAALAAKQEPCKPVAWGDAQRICDLPRIDEEIRNLLDDHTNDNATCLIRSIMELCRCDAAPVAVAAPIAVATAVGVAVAVPSDHVPDAGKMMPNMTPAIDSNVEANRQALLDRSNVGIKKYGVTTDRDDLSERDWLNHALEESLDLGVYLRKLIRMRDTAAVPSVPVAEPLKWEATTPAFIRYITDSRYKKFKPEVQKWYKPICDCQAAPVQQAPLTDEEIAKGWRATFSTENPYCPCNLKSFTKAVRWHERRILSGEKA